MAGGQERILRRRIRSVQSTKKITRAMELIAASRIVKAQARVQAAQPYADGITGVMRDLAAGGAGTTNPMLAARDTIATVAYIAIAADRGLCGGYNTQIVRTTERAMRAEAAAGRRTLLVTSGRKPESYFRFRDVPIEASFAGFSDGPSYEDARAIAASLSQKFLDGEIDRVEIVYTKFTSAGRQDVVVEPLMPLDSAGLSGTPTPAGEHEGPGGASATSGVEAPRGARRSRAGVDTSTNPRRTRFSTRSRRATPRPACSRPCSTRPRRSTRFRQRAMKAATDNADDLIRSLSRVMNRARQDAITTEIMEIVGGAEALGSGSDTDDDFLTAN